MTNLIKTVVYIGNYDHNIPTNVFILNKFVFKLIEIHLTVFITNANLVSFNSIPFIYTMYIEIYILRLFNLNIIYYYKV